MKLLEDNRRWKAVLLPRDLPTTEEEFEADLSPDEKLIATREGIIDWQGNKIADFGHMLVEGPRWSPDGSQVAGLDDCRGAKQIFVFTLPKLK